MVPYLYEQMIEKNKWERQTNPLQIVPALPVAASSQGRGGAYHTP